MTLNSTLDILLNLVKSLLLAQNLALIVALRKPNDCQTFFNIQLRLDILLSQSITLVTTMLLTALENNPSAFQPNIPPLFTYFSFLSCYKEEKGMIEDMFEIFSNFYGFVQFRFIPSGSTVIVLWKINKI